MRPEGPKIEAEGRDRAGWGSWEGQQAQPARGSGSDVNKTKFLRPKSRPKYQDQKPLLAKTKKTNGNKQRHWADLTFK